MLFIIWIWHLWGGHLVGSLIENGAHIFSEKGVYWCFGWGFWWGAFFSTHKLWKERHAQVKISKLFETTNKLRWHQFIWENWSNWMATSNMSLPITIETLILGCTPLTLVSFTRVILKSGHFFWLWVSYRDNISKKTMCFTIIVACSIEHLKSRG